MKLFDTNNKTEKANIIWYFCLEITTVCGNIFASVTFVQSFMLELGLNSTNIGAIGFVGQLFVIAGYLVFIGDTSSGGKVQSRYFRTVLFYGLTPAALIIAGIYAGRTGVQNMTVVLIALMTATAVQNVAMAYNMILGTKMLVKVIDVKYCGQIFGVAGIVGNLLGAGVSLVSTAFMKRNGYPTGFYLVFIVSILFYIMNAVIISRFKLIYNRDNEGSGIEEYIRRKRRIPVLNVRKLWGNPQIRSLFLPNLLRGIGVAGPYYIMTIGKKNLDLPAVYSNYIATAAILGTVIGNIIFSIVISRYPTGKVVLAGTVLSALSLIFLCVSGSPVLFLIFNFILVMGQIHVDTGVPTGMYKNIPEDMIGAVTGIRMLLMSIGTALSVFAGGYILDNYSALPFILFIAVTQISSSFLFQKVLVK